MGTSGLAQPTTLGPAGAPVGSSSWPGCATRLWCRKAPDPLLGKGHPRGVQPSPPTCPTPPVGSDGRTPARPGLQQLALPPARVLGTCSSLACRSWASEGLGAMAAWTQGQNQSCPRGWTGWWPGAEAQGRSCLPARGPPAARPPLCPQASGTSREALPVPWGQADGRWPR